MQGLFFQYLLTLHPLVLAGALFPLGGALVLWIWFFRVFHARCLKPLAQGFEKAASAGEKMEGRSMENAAAFQEALEDSSFPAMTDPWKRLKEDIEGCYGKSALPEAESYFPYNNMIGVSGGRKYLPVVWGVFALLSLLSLLLPPLASLLMEAQLGITPILSLICLALLSLGQGIFILLDQRLFRWAETAYYRFVSQFNRVLPIADALAGPAMLLAATQANQKAVSDSAERIEHAFFSFSNEIILPALRDTSNLLIQETLVPAMARIDASLKDAMEAFSLRQDREMKLMTEAFVSELTYALRGPVSSLGESLTEAGSGIVTLNEQLKAHLTAISLMLQEQQGALHETQALSIKTMQSQEAMAEIHIALDEKVTLLSAAIEKMEQNIQRFVGDALKAFADTNAVQQAFSERMTEASDKMARQYGGAGELLAQSIGNLKVQHDEWNRTMGQTIKDIADTMNEAVVNAGREMGRGLADVTGENARSIADLGEISGALSKEYETYFSRMENTSSQTLAEMDFHMQNVIAKVSDELGAMLTNMLSQNTQVLSQYNESTQGLLRSFEEQSRSMGLYAKEINYDISELSSSMKESVEDFTTRIQNGINLAMSSLDNGLGELSERIANTVESIGDAVENLPKALGRDV